MDDPILVTGGTGTLGQLVVSRLQGLGRPVRVLSRRTAASGPNLERVTGDLQTGEGVDAAVSGAGVIVHCAGTSKGDEVKASNLVQAASRVGSPHIVFISVVGCGRIPVKSSVDRALFGYFASKFAAESVIAESGLPWTTLRASQFHDLIFKTAKQMARIPVIPVPRTRVQPIDAAEIADRMTELALGEPCGLVPDMAGPQIHTMTDLVSSYLTTFRKHRLLVPARMPGSAARAFREGANLNPERAVGHRTWQQYLDDKRVT